MSNTRRSLRATFGAVALTAPCWAGCGPEPMAPGQASSIPLANPSPDNPYKDITLENESEHIDKIGGISGLPTKPASKKASK